MKTDEVRDRYLAFFQSKEHVLVPSDSLVPQNDPTLLFTGAGMNQFKEYFLGLKKDLRRATSSQKCLRTGDLEEVGKTAFHHSFFEMLGNFSFGDYFKKEAIHWAWEFLTIELGLSKERLRISVHKDDHESFQIWKDEIKIRPDWIYPLGDKGNFWPANAPQDGPNGPCGPCSEIYYDQNPADPAKGSVDDTTGRFAEIWNLVFTQYDRQGVGQLVPLAQKNIDTGMGLERLACILQGKSTNYEIDIFQPINERLENLLKFKKDAVQGPARQHLYAISDHLRAILFCMSDGVIPSNEGRGYVIRKLIRRALWRAHQIVSPARDLKGPFLFEAISVVCDVMKKTYPELSEAAASIVGTLKGEEERFLDTLETGLRILEQKISRLQDKKDKVISGADVFELYDTYGFPDELTHMIAQSRNLKIDQAGFNQHMSEQKRRAKESTQISASIFSATELEKNLTSLPPTHFLGYETMAAKAKIILLDLKDSEGVVLLDQSPFYGESGGQLGDRGTLKNDQFEARVLDTQKKNHHILHRVEILRGKPLLGQEVTASVDTVLRLNIMRNHTATHLLHAALRKHLGNQVRQLGSLVAPEKLRFDYSYSQALTREQVREIENTVNQEILKNTSLTKEEKPIEDAKQEGAIAFFGEKYGSKVRVVTVPGFSKELCGGTHLDNTGQIGLFYIVSDASIASGTRRIEAQTGEAALQTIQKMRQELTDLSSALKTTPDLLSERVTKLQENLKKLEKEKKSGQSSKVDPDKILSNAHPAGELSFAVFRGKDLDVNDLRHLSDQIAGRSKRTIYFLTLENADKIHYLLGLSQDLRSGISAGTISKNLTAPELGKLLGPFLQGNAGGRAELIQGGAQNNGQLQDHWDAIIQAVVTYLKEKVNA